MLCLRFTFYILPHYIYLSFEIINIKWTLKMMSAWQHLSNQDIQGSERQAAKHECWCDQMIFLKNRYLFARGFHWFTGRYSRGTWTWFVHWRWWWTSRTQWGGRGWSQTHTPWSGHKPAPPGSAPSASWRGCGCRLCLYCQITWSNKILGWRQDEYWVWMWMVTCLIVTSHSSYLPSVTPFYPCQFSFLFQTGKDKRTNLI